MFIFLVFTGMSIVPVDSDTNDDKGEKEEQVQDDEVQDLSLIHISEPTRPY